MTSRSLLRPSIRPDLYICARCSLRARTGLPKVSRRGIGLKYLQKVADAEAQWKEKADRIEKGEVQSMLSILEERGYINQIVGTRNNLDTLLTTKRLGAYVGIDPTAPSLHIGHMLPLMTLFWMFVHGYQAVTLLGGATAKIGDPTGRTKDREDINKTVRTENMIKMHYQLKKLWLNVEHYGRRRGYNWEWAWKRGLLNNNTWINKLGVLELMQTLGSGMRMGTMLSRDTVKTKMKSSDGMSFAEFTYPLLQAWDWWHMYTTRKIQMQIGGSDQFGNIVAGIDAINYLRSHHHDPVIREEVDAADSSLSPIGLTTTLLTSGKGEKMGKSAGNALWLDGEMTSPFDLYGFWLRQPDGDLERYLKFFTFLPMQTIRDTVKEHMKDPKKRVGQHLLAREFLELIHGQEVAQHTEMQHRLLFSKSSTPTSEDGTSSEIYGSSTQPFSGENPAPNLNHVGSSPTPTIELPRSFIETKSMGQILYAAGLASSRSDGHRLASKGGAYIGGQANIKNKLPFDEGAISWNPVKIWLPSETSKFIVNDILVLRKGKNAVKIIRLLSDEEWAKSGKTYPGEGSKAADPPLEDEIVDKTTGEAKRLKWERENTPKLGFRRITGESRSNGKTKADSNSNIVDLSVSENKKKRREAERERDRAEMDVPEDEHEMTMAGMQQQTSIMTHEAGKQWGEIVHWRNERQPSEDEPYSIHGLRPLKRWNYKRRPAESEPYSFHGARAVRMQKSRRKHTTLTHQYQWRQDLKKRKLEKKKANLEFQLRWRKLNADAGSHRNEKKGEKGSGNVREFPLLRGSVLR